MPGCATCAGQFRMSFALAQRLAVMQWRAGRVAANGVSSLLCTQGDISNLRRHFCTRRIKMLPRCQLEMTLPGGYPGMFGVTVRLMTDGKLSRLVVLRDLNWRQLTTEAAVQLPRASAPSNVPAVEGLSERRRDGLDFAAAWSPEQPVQAGGASDEGAGDHSLALLNSSPTPATGKLREVHGIAPGPSGRQPQCKARDAG